MQCKANRFNKDDRGERERLGGGGGSSLTARVRETCPVWETQVQISLNDFSQYSKPTIFYRHLWIIMSESRELERSFHPSSSSLGPQKTLFYLIPLFLVPFVYEDYVWTFRFVYKSAGTLPVVSFICLNFGFLLGFRSRINAFAGRLFILIERLWINMNLRKHVIYS